MLLGIDHLVIAVQDPDAAAALMEADLGLAVTGGGRHEHAGTFNRLAFLGDTYLELIGVFDRSLVEAATGTPIGRASLALLETGREGLATYALATDGLVGEVSRLRTHGSLIGDAVPGSRTRTDGEVVRWLTAFGELGPECPPFLIEHEPAGSEWGSQARMARAAFRHPVGGRVRLEAITLPVEDRATVRVRYQHEVGVDVRGDGTAVVRDQGIRLVRAHDAALPAVALAGDPGTPALDLVRFGIRWTRSPAAAPDAQIG
jgi:hypothetical protein